MEAANRQQRLEQFVAACRASGLSVTSQRQAVYEAVLDSGEHPTADAVFDAVRPRLPSISRTTVYRVLDRLVDLGVIEKACSPGSVARFDAVTDRHHHLVCVRCDRVFDLDEDKVKLDIELPPVHADEFDIRDYSIRFTGICVECQKAARPESAPE